MIFVPAAILWHDEGEIAKVDGARLKHAVIEIFDARPQYSIGDKSEIRLNASAIAALTGWSTAAATMP